MSRTAWATRAQLDLAAIDDHYRELSPQHADRMGRLAIAAGRFLADFPHAGPPVDENIRKWRVAGTDYILLYRITGSSIEVLRVHHAREDWRV